MQQNGGSSRLDMDTLPPPSADGVHVYSLHVDHADGPLVAEFVSGGQLLQDHQAMDVRLWMRWATMLE